MGHEVMFVAIDFIQNMTGIGEGMHEQTQYIAGELAAIATEENVCLIEISQLTSKAGREKGTEQHNYIRFGKVFQEAADCIITLTDPARSSKKKKKQEEDEDFDVPEEKDYTKMIAHVVQRNGLSNIRIPIIAQLQYSSFKTD
jgi:replicative DNA helicase